MTAGSGLDQKCPGSAEENRSSGCQSDQVSVTLLVVEMPHTACRLTECPFHDGTCSFLCVSARTERPSRRWSWTGLISTRPTAWMNTVGDTVTQAQIQSSTPTQPACRTSECVCVCVCRCACVCVCKFVLCSPAECVTARRGQSLQRTTCARLCRNIRRLTVSGCHRTKFS